jgi:hypothetical protein
MEQNMTATHLHFEIEVDAHVEAVWEALWGDQSWPRIFTDMLELETEPRGSAVVGQSFHYVRRIEGKSVHFFYKLTEVQHLKSWRGIENSPSLLEKLEDRGTLVGTGNGTRIIVDYYLEKAPRTGLTVKELREGLDAFWQAAKKLIESTSI